MTITANSARLTTVATFPEHFFLENLAVRPDGSILVTVPNHRQLWFVAAPDGERDNPPVLVHTFDDLPMGIVETEPDIFYVATAQQPTLQRVDLRGWSPGAPVHPAGVLRLDPASVLNGACLVGPRTILVADSVRGIIWRVDVADGEAPDVASCSVWLEHPTMAPDADNGLVSILGPQPGLNGIRYSPATESIYYTSTGQHLFARVPVDPANLAPAGPPVVVAHLMADDFCIDDGAGVAYLTTHTDNTIVAVPLTPGADDAQPVVVAGDPFVEQLVGPSSAVWARGPADYGRVAYVTTDGGHTAVEYGRAGSDGKIRPGALLRVEFDR